MPLELYWQSSPWEAHVEQTGFLLSHFVLCALQLKHATGTRCRLRLTCCEEAPYWGWGFAGGCPSLSEK
jgi:hypothetical protein